MIFLRVSNGNTILGSNGMICQTLQFLCYLGCHHVHLNSFRIHSLSLLVLLSSTSLLALLSSISLLAVLSSISLLAVLSLLPSVINSLSDIPFFVSLSSLLLVEEESLE